MISCQHYRRRNNSTVHRGTGCKPKPPKQRTENSRWSCLRGLTIPNRCNHWVSTFETKRIGTPSNHVKEETNKLEYINSIFKNSAKHGDVSSLLFLKQRAQYLPTQNIKSFHMLLTTYLAIKPILLKSNPVLRKLNKPHFLNYQFFPTYHINQTNFTNPKIYQIYNYITEKSSSESQQLPPSREKTNIIVKTASRTLDLRRKTYHPVEN